MMDLSNIQFYLLAFVISLLVIFVVKHLIFLQRLPPGPWSLPLIGPIINLVKLNKSNAILEFMKYKEKYGKIVSVSVGHYYLVVINDYKLIIDTFKKYEFLGRPDFEGWVLRNGGLKNRGISFSDGVDTWSEQRRFALRTLRDFGFARESMQGMLHNELNDLIEAFGKDAGKPIEIGTILNAAVFNSLWNMLTGKRFKLDDDEFAKIINLMRGHLQKVFLVHPGNYYPWPAKYNLIRRGLRAKMIVMLDTVYNMIDRVIDEHITTYDENQSRDFIDAYLKHAKTVDSTSSFYKEQGIKHLRVTLLDLFVAGTETSSTTITWAILYLTKHPEIQKKIYSEIESVIGKERLPCREDQPSMPYMEAFCNEVHRKATLLPMSVYHKAQENIYLEGHFIPKGTIIYPNLYDAHHDKEYWKDPQNFRPERFLDENNALIKHEPLMPFSTGKRQCLGEVFARQTLFIFLTGILQKFSFELDAESRNIDIDTPKPNFVVSPDPFKVIITIRE